MALEYAQQQLGTALSTQPAVNPVNSTKMTTLVRPVARTGNAMQRVLGPYIVPSSGTPRLGKGSPEAAEGTVQDQVLSDLQFCKKLFFQRTAGAYIQDAQGGQNWRSD